ncbi:hypothetical protein UFOVP1670_32 [uncultured Caudovirales phage]|uniref:Uncharacterized protein n=1 Tax=uncultured Caudovirales phage TaxID=2100421 RepID=A0A6J5T747_9CAUD|nr:hypothetical protein UFOVP1670_32 [uncultured Caudovirales phage]
MAMQKIVVLDQCQIPNGRNVIGDFCMLIIEDGRVISKSAPHTINMQIDDDYAAVLAENNQDITTRPDLLWPAIQPDEWARFVGYCEISHTPEIKAAYAIHKNKEVR